MLHNIKQRDYNADVYVFQFCSEQITAQRPCVAHFFSSLIFNKQFLFCTVALLHFIHQFSHVFLLTKLLT